MDKRPKGRLPRLTDGFHLQDIGNAAKSAASLDKLRKFLESQKLIKWWHKAWVPVYKASVPRAQSLGLLGTKLGLGRAQKRFPRVLHLGPLHCALWADQGLGAPYIVATLGSIVATCATRLHCSYSCIVVQPWCILTLTLPSNNAMCCSIQY